MSARTLQVSKFWDIRQNWTHYGQFVVVSTKFAWFTQIHLSLRIQVRKDLFLQPPDERSGEEAQYYSTEANLNGKCDLTVQPFRQVNTVPSCQSGLITICLQNNRPCNIKYIFGEFSSRFYDRDTFSHNIDLSCPDICWGACIEKTKDSIFVSALYDPSLSIATFSPSIYASADSDSDLSVVWSCAGSRST